MLQYEEHTQIATEAEAHVEWHLNAGVPIGQGPCPWDACGHDEYGQEDFPPEAPTPEFPFGPRSTATGVSWAIDFWVNEFDRIFDSAERKLDDLCIQIKDAAAGPLPF